MLHELTRVRAEYLDMLKREQVQEWVQPGAHGMRARVEHDGGNEISVSQGGRHLCAAHGRGRWTASETRERHRES